MPVAEIYPKGSREPREPRERRLCAVRHPTRVGIGLIRLGDSGFVPANPEDDLRGKAVYDA